MDDLDKLPAPEIIAGEIVDDLEYALEQLKEINGDLEAKKGEIKLQKIPIKKFKN